MARRLKLDNDTATIENVEPGGNLTIRAGSDPEGNGGAVYVEGGGGSGAGTGGPIYLQPGYGGGAAPTLPIPSGVPEPTEFWFVDANASAPGYVGFKAPDDVSTGSTGDGNDTVWTLPEGDGSANQVMITDGGGVLSWSSLTGLGGMPLDEITAAGGSATISNGANNIRWNWALTSDGQRGMSFRESADSINGSGDQALVEIRTNSDTSTASPFFVFQSSHLMIAARNTGDLALQSGFVSGNPGNISIFGGTATATDVDGSNIFIRTGDGDGTGDGGYIELRPGRAPGAGLDGYVTIGGLVGLAPDLRWEEDAGNGTDYLGLKAPDSVANSKIFELAPKVVSVDHTAPYAVDEADDLIVANASGGNVTINLHLAANERFRVLRVKRVDASGTYTVTINRAGGDLIDGAASLVIPVSSQWVSYTLINDKGTDWYIT